MSSRTDDPRGQGRLGERHAEAGGALPSVRHFRFRRGLVTHAARRPGGNAPRASADGVSAGAGTAPGSVERGVEGRGPGHGRTPADSQGGSRQDSAES